MRAKMFPEIRFIKLSWCLCPVLSRMKRRARVTQFYYLLFKTGTHQEGDKRRNPLKRLSLRKSESLWKSAKNRYFPSRKSAGALGIDRGAARHSRMV